MFDRLLKMALQKLGRRVLFRKAFMSKLSRDPTNAQLHFELAELSLKSGNAALAYAEAKTAQFLGLQKSHIRQFMVEVKSGLPVLNSISHNKYFRYVTLASEIKEISEDKSASILDVGGGSGELAQFLPEFAYCLAEPSVNGISGLDLPFKENSFDFVVACHVLEHIPKEEREQFLNQLMSKARKGLVLLNPFKVPGTKVKERLELVIEITGASWAKEHLECELPMLEFIKQYACDRNFELSLKPNGTMSNALVVVFMEHFAMKCGKTGQLTKISSLLNSLPESMYNSTIQPNAYLIYLKH